MQEQKEPTISTLLPGDFLERFQRLESEKLNVLRQVVTQERDLESKSESIAKLEEEKNALLQEQASHQELVEAVKEGKRAVEQKLQAVLADNSGLSQQVSTWFSYDDCQCLMDC